jgi:hypothetical protein
MTIDIPLVDWERNEVVLALRFRAKVRRELGERLRGDHSDWKGDDTPAGVLLAQADKLEALAQRFAEAQGEMDR